MESIDGEDRVRVSYGIRSSGTATALELGYNEIKRLATTNLPNFEECKRLAWEWVCSQYESPGEHIVFDDATMQFQIGAKIVKAVRPILRALEADGYFILHGHMQGGSIEMTPEGIDRIEHPCRTVEITSPILVQQQNVHISDSVVTHSQFNPSALQANVRVASIDEIKQALADMGLADEDIDSFDEAVNESDANRGLAVWTWLRKIAVKLAERKIVSGAETQFDRLVESIGAYLIGGPPN